MSATTYKWAIKTDGKLEQASKLLRIYCVLNNLYPSDTGILIGAYIMVYGFSDEVRKNILQSGILGTNSSLTNEMYSLRRMGILEGTKNNTRISTKVVPANIQPITPQTLLIINLDNR